MGYLGGYSHWDSILFGRRSGYGYGYGYDQGHDHGHGKGHDKGHDQGDRHGHDNKHGHGCCDGGHGHKGTEEVIVSPTKEIVKVRKHFHTIKRIHPTHIKYIDKKITRIENYYPVTESYEKENYVEEYDCGHDVKHPCCKPVKNKKWC